MVGWFICVIIERDFLDIFFFLILCFCFVLFHSKLEFPIDMCSTIFVCLGCFLTSSHLPLDSESFLEIVSIECFTCPLLPFLYIFSWISATTKTYLFSFVFLLTLSFLAALFPSITEKLWKQVLSIKNFCLSVNVQCMLSG